MAITFPKASRIGFGCASLGSRIGSREGLRALEKAYDLGINWIDVAPSYGDGNAEGILAQFAGQKRDRLHICTKCGIAPANVGLLARAIKPMARAVVKAMPHLRSLVSGGRASATNMPLSASLIRDSLDHSLRRLGTDHVEVYALHDPSPDALASDEIRRALDDVLSSGKARVVGIAGSLEAAVAARRAGLPIGFVQIADPPFEGRLEQLRAAIGNGPPLTVSTHSVYGRGDPQDLLETRAGSRARLAELLTAYGYAMPLADAVRAALLDIALLRNLEGIVLLSMFSGNHLERNAARLNANVAEHARKVLAALSSNAAAGELHG